MEFVAAREFRIRPGAVWKRLKKSKRVVVTSNGKPIALLTGLEGRDLEQEIEADVVARGIAAAARIRESARRSGASKMSMDEIDKEIQEARKTY